MYGIFPYMENYIICCGKLVGTIYATVPWMCHGFSGTDHGDGHRGTT